MKQQAGKADLAGKKEDGKTVGRRYLWKQGGDGDMWTLVRTPTRSRVEYMATKVRYPLIIPHPLTFPHQGELPD